MTFADSLDFEDRLSSFGSATFPSLREGQRLVLSAYGREHLETADLGIEMPTGAGKTLVALLIADLALERGRSVAYLTGTRHLADQVLAEARKLGLDAVRFTGGNYGGAWLDDYHQANSLGVMNYWVYFNAKPVPQPADLLILDDAHLAEQPLSLLQTLRIPNKRGSAQELYRNVCDLIIAHTDAYTGVRAMLDGLAAPGTPPELLSFCDWAAICDVVREAIETSEFAKENEVKWVWPTVREHLTRCGVLIGPSGIEIRPYHPPTTLNAGYSRTKQRLYLSATLGSMDDLQRRIGGDPVRRLVPEKALPKGETGERRLVLNATSGQPLDSHVLDWALEQVALAGGRAAWLCASTAEADLVQEALIGAGQSVFRLRPGDDDMVESWSRALIGNLVTAGRYDGLDLPGDICRLVILTSVPRASSEFERFVVAYLGDASYMRHRVGQRVTQALGRANRTASDRSLYLGLDPTFAQVLADPAVRASIPDDTGATIREALELYDEGWEATRVVCRRFWLGQSRSVTPAASTDPTASSSRQRIRPGRSTSGSRDVASAAAEVLASTSLWAGDHRTAVESAVRAAEELSEAGETEHAAFWRYVEAHAYFDRGRGQDLALARNALEDATEQGPRTTWFRRLSRTVDELAGHTISESGDSDRLFLVWDEWGREAGARLDTVLGNARAMMSGSHDQQCEAMTVLARLAGVAGENVGKSEQSSTDCRWTWSTSKRSERRVWEVKTGLSETVARTDVNQLLGQIEVETKRAPRSRVFGCLLTPAKVASIEAAEAARDKIALVSHEAAMRLFNTLADRFRQYAALSGDGSAEARGRARTAVESLLPSERWLEMLLSPTQGRVIAVDEISSLFPSR